MHENLLEVHGLSTNFFITGNVIRAVDNVSLRIMRGETLGVVGETGCGKSAMAMSIMRLIPWPPGKIIAGSVIFEGEDLVKKSEKEMRSLRGRKMTVIFQEPRTSMNPVFRIGSQMVEVLMLHQNLSKAEALKKAIELLERVKVAESSRVVNFYPHELSGGMLQRVMIAMGFACNPSLLIADEPTTALDVTIQAQILRLLKELQEQLNIALLFITHDLGVVAQICDRVMVMYAGSVVESCSVEELFENPLHPYTKGLIGAVPRLDEDREELAVIGGSLPDPGNQLQGCKFWPRCTSGEDRCSAMGQELLEVKKDHYVASCSLYLCRS